jgi:YD repeat-containing protein
MGKVTSSTAYAENMDIDGRPDDSALYGIATSYLYDLDGNVTKKTFANSETIAYTYDALGRVTSEARNVPNENNANVAVTKTTDYDSMGNVTSRKDEKGSYTYYAYSAQGFLTRSTDAMGAVAAMEYDLQGRLVKAYSPRALLQDEPGHIVAPPAGGANWAAPPSYTSVNYTAYAYDKMGRLLTKTETYRPTYSSVVRSIVSETNTWDRNGNLLTTKDAMNNTTAYTYNVAGRMSQAKDALNQSTQYAYDGLGRLVTETNANGVETGLSYDPYGNLTQKSIAGIVVMTATYDYLGDRLTEADGKGNSTIYAYSLTGQVRASTNAIGYNTRYWRDAMGNMTRSLDSLGWESVNVYDGWGRLKTEMQQGSGGLQRISRSKRYDVLGNAVYAVDEMGDTTQYAYDRLSRVTAVKNALNQTSTVAYDSNGNKVSEADWLGNTTVRRYDILDRLIASIDPDNVQVETLTYTDNNLQATSTDALNHTTNYTYDALKRLTSSTDAAGHTTSQTYDPAGNVATRTDGNGNVTSGFESLKVAFCTEIIFHQARRDEGAYPLGM